MSSTPSRSTNFEVASRSALRGSPHLDPAAQPARPLAPKTAALHARRRQRPPPAAVRRTRGTSTGQLTSDDGALHFVVRDCASGLYMERTQRRPLGFHLTQALVFPTPQQFSRWFEIDPVRFEHPVLYHELRRHGDDYFGSSR
jgi:hypothetical protein